MVGGVSPSKHGSSNLPPSVAGLRHPLPRPQVEAENAPEWLIAEDWALLQAIREILELPLNLTVSHFIKLSSFPSRFIYRTPLSLESLTLSLHYNVHRKSAKLVLNVIFLKISTSFEC